MSFPVPRSSDVFDPMPDEQARTATTRECRDNFFAVLREIHETGVPMVLTKRGKPYVRIVREVDIPGDMFGCDRDVLQIVGDIDEPLWSENDFDMAARPHQILG